MNFQEKNKKKFQKVAKNIILGAFATGVAAYISYSIIVNAELATENNINNISEDLDTSTESKTENSVETQLTSEEIDKIIQDLKLTGNIDNILEKLDEIIARAKLTNNTALQDYAESMKESYKLQSELDSVNSLIESMKKKNKEIAAVDKQVRKILSVTTITSDLDGAVSDETLLILQSISTDDMKKLQDLIAEIENLFDLNNIELLTVQERSLLDILVLTEIQNQNIELNEIKQELLENTLGVAVTILESYQKDIYSEQEYDNLISGTEKFMKVGKKCSTVLPEQIATLNNYFTMNHSPIVYDGHILMAMEDLYMYIDATIEHMYNNATMVITSPGKTLEVTAGKNLAYLNDKPYNMSVPILSYQDTIYMSVEFFAQAYDISYKYLPEHNFIILYNNLNQLTNPSVPNELSK